MKRLTDAATKIKVMQRVIDDLHLDRPVIISPSMSGSFAIPFLMQNEPISCQQRSRGFVPVAPAASDLYSTDQFKQCEVGVAMERLNLHLAISSRIVVSGLF